MPASETQAQITSWPAPIRRRRRSASGIRYVPRPFAASHSASYARGGRCACSQRWRWSHHHDPAGSCPACNHAPTGRRAPSTSGTQAAMAPLLHGSDVFRESCRHGRVRRRGGKIHRVLFGERGSAGLVALRCKAKSITASSASPPFSTRMRYDSQSLLRRSMDGQCPAGPDRLQFSHRGQHPWSFPE